MALTVIWVVLLAVVLMARALTHDADPGANAVGARRNQTGDRGADDVFDGQPVAVAAAERQQSATTSLTWTNAITDLRVLASSADIELVGRAVDITNAPINALASIGGFWVVSNEEHIFVLTADETHFTRGQRVNLRGVVLELPDGMKNRLDDYNAARHETIYIYATQVRAVT